MAQTQKDNNNSGSAQAKRLIAVLAVMLLLMTALLVYFLVVKADDKSAKGGQREAAALEGSINQMSDEEIQQALDNIVEEGMFRISIASDIIAVEGGKAQLRIENNIQNRYIMQVSIYLDENGQEIYSTDFIDPGYYILEAELDRQLEPGDYEATAVFSAYYPDTEELVGQVGANVMLHVYPNPDAEKQEAEGK